MRHRKKAKKFNRNKDHRKALFKNLALALFEYESIRTTQAKAKEVSRLVDKIITFAKEGTLSARREVARVIPDKKILGKIFQVIAPRFKERPGGYTRIYKLNNRKGDNASLVLLELVVKSEKEKPRKKISKQDEVKEKAAESKEKKIVSPEEKKVAEKEKEEERRKIDQKKKFPGFTKIFKRKSFGQRPEK